MRIEITLIYRAVYPKSGLSQAPIPGNNVAHGKLDQHHLKVSFFGICEI
jgi:hypothetical protein